MKNIVAVFALALAGCVSIDPGNVGVETKMGRVTGDVYAEGTHPMLPWYSVHEMSVRMLNLDEVDIPCRSHDNVSVLADVTVSYTLNRNGAPRVFKQLGDDYANLLILPSTRSVTRDVIATASALEVQQSRGTLEDAIGQQLRAGVVAILRSQHLPANTIRIDSVQLRNTDLPQSLTASIESIQQQRNQGLEREQAIQTVRQEAERARIEAEGRNRVVMLNAQREADVRRIAGDSEASYNRTVSASLTPALIELRRIAAQQAIATNPNAQLVVIGGGGSGGSPVILQAPAPR